MIRFEGRQAMCMHALLCMFICVCVRVSESIYVWRVFVFANMCCMCVHMRMSVCTYVCAIVSSWRRTSCLFVHICVCVCVVCDCE